MPTDLTDRQRIAANVRAEMARLGKNQNDIAAVLGIVQPVVSLRLNGKRAFRAEELSAIADAWGVPVAQFYGELVSVEVSGPPDNRPPNKPPAGPGPGHPGGPPPPPPPTNPPAKTTGRAA